MYLVMGEKTYRLKYCKNDKKTLLLFLGQGEYAIKNDVVERTVQPGQHAEIDSKMAAVTIESGESREQQWRLMTSPGEKIQLAWRHYANRSIVQVRISAHSAIFADN